jgi:hypothetical protein
MVSINQALKRSIDLLTRNKTIADEAAQRYQRYTTESAPIDTRDKVAGLFNSSYEDEIKCRGAFESEIVDNRVNLGLSKPFTITAADKTQQQSVEGLYNYNNLHVMSKEIMRNTGACGASAVYLFQPEDGDAATIEMMPLRPWEYAVFRNSRGQVVYALRIWAEAIALESDEGAIYNLNEAMKEAGATPKEGAIVNLLKCEYIDADNYYYFRGQKASYTDSLAYQDTALQPDELQQERQGAPNLFNMAPIVDIQGLKGRRPYYFNSLTWIDAYNILTTDSISEFDAVRSAILVLKNYGLADTVDEDGATTETVKAKMKRMRAITIDDNGEVKWLIKDIQVDALKTIESILRRNIDRFSNNIDYSDPDVYGRATNLAVVTRIQGAKNAAKDMCDQFEIALNNIIKICNNIWQPLNKAVDITKLEIEFVYDMPVNTQEEVNNFVSMKGAGISAEDALSTLSFVKDPAAWAERMNDEMERIITGGNNDDDKSDQTT